MCDLRGNRWRERKEIEGESRRWEDGDEVSEEKVFNAVAVDRKIDFPSFI